MCFCVCTLAAGPCFNKLLIESFISNDSFKMAHSIENKLVRPSEWTVESLAHSIASTPCCYALLYTINSTFVFTASRTCADIQKSTLLVQWI